MGTFRFKVQLQKGSDTLATSKKDDFTSPPTHDQGVEIVEGLRTKGKTALPKKAHDAFEIALDDLKEKVPYSRVFSGNGDFAKVEFTYGGEKYRVEMGNHGDTADAIWFT